MGREEVILDCLRDLLAQNHKGCEHLVILQGPDSALIANRIKGLFGDAVRTFILDVPNASMARNIGLIEARGKIALFLDDDVRIRNPNFTANHLRNYADPTVPGVYGQVLEIGQQPVRHPPRSVIETDWGWAFLPPNYSLRCRTRNGGSGNLSVRREWAIAVGGMDAWFERGARREETEFNLRLTRRYGPLIFDPEAGLVHLSAGGGSRMWGHITHTVPQHHIVGHWYFFLRTIFDRTSRARGVLRELKHIAIALIKNPQRGKSIWMLIRNTLRAIWGLGIAFVCSIRGPRRIDTLDANCYREIPAGTP